MAKIDSIKSGRARIHFDGFIVRLFVKYKKNYCSAIRIWKLPGKGSFLSMLNNKNLFWVVYDDQAKSLHGWFHKEGDLLTALARKIEKCSNEDDLKRFCLNLENIITEGAPLDIDSF